jgi:hypothetical protein
LSAGKLAPQITHKELTPQFVPRGKRLGLHGSELFDGPTCFRFPTSNPDKRAIVGIDQKQSYRSLSLGIEEASIVNVSRRQGQRERQQESVAVFGSTAELSQPGSPLRARTQDFAVVTRGMSTSLAGLTWSKPKVFEVKKVHRVLLFFKKGLNDPRAEASHIRLSFKALEYEPIDLLTKVLNIAGRSVCIGLTYIPSSYGPDTAGENSYPSGDLRELGFLDPIACFHGSHAGQASEADRENGKPNKRAHRQLPFRKTNLSGLAKVLR